MVIKLLEAGHEVRATMRNLSRADSMRQVYARQTDRLEGLEFAALDLVKDEGWEEVMAGADYLIHMASPVPLQTPKSESDIIEPARQGALRALKAAAGAGVKRVVLTSSVAAIMYGHDPGKTSFTETDWSDPKSNDNSAYTRSKTLVERAAWEYVQKEEVDLELVTINPGLVLGPILEADFGASAVVVKKLLEGAFPGTPKIGFPITDVRDVVDLHLLAMTHSKAAGERFIAANGFMWMQDIAKILKAKLPDASKKVPVKNLPNWLMRILANFDKEVKAVAFELNRYRQADGAKATELLGWQPRSNEEAVTDCAESLIAHKVLEG